MGVQLFIWDPLNAKQSCPQSIFGTGYVKMHGFNAKVSKGAKIRNRYNQVPHMTKDTNGKVTNTVRHHKREPRGQPFPSR